MLWRGHISQQSVESLHGRSLLGKCNPAEDPHQLVQVVLWWRRRRTDTSLTIVNRDEEQLAQDEKAVSCLHEPRKANTARVPRRCEVLAA